MGGITITKVPARHGDNLETVAYLGESSGYVLQGEDKNRLYLCRGTLYILTAWRRPLIPTTRM